MPADPGYTLWFNNSATSGDSNDVREMLQALDQEVMRAKLSSVGMAPVNVTSSWAHFPFVPARIAQLDVVTANGGVYFYLVPMIVFFVLLTSIVQEKDANLRTGMRMMGMSSLVYWTCWSLQAVVFVVASTLVLMVSAAACQFHVFLRSNQFVVFLMFALYGFAIVAMAFCFSAFTSRVQTAQAVGYGLILLGFIFQSILTSGYGVFVDILYSNDVPGWVVLLRFIFMQYPPFNFAKIYSDVAFLSGDTVDFRQGVVNEGAGFYWRNLFDYRCVGERYTNGAGEADSHGCVCFSSRSTIKLGPASFIIPPPYQALLVLIWNAASWGVLSWYFNNITGEGALRWNFPFTAEYWGFGARQQSVAVSDGAEGEVLVEVSSLHKEVRRVLCFVRASIAHKRGSSLCRACATDTASPLWRTFPSRSARARFWACWVRVNRCCFVFFGAFTSLSCAGHNGAGKSTTINMLTGLVVPTSGSLTVAGLDVLKSLASVRQLLGVCPQHDILWDDLTAVEHLRLFAQLKGMHTDEAEHEAWAKLEMVGLQDVGNNRTSTYSGGMKRRLSVAISAIGDPLLILLDEVRGWLEWMTARVGWRASTPQRSRPRAWIPSTRSKCGNWCSR